MTPGDPTTSTGINGNRIATGPSAMPTGPALADLETLSALAVGLCHDCTIGVELSPKMWAWDPARRVILVSSEDLKTHGPMYCAGVIAHEVGHYFITRYPLFSLPFPSLPALSFILNAIEDPRVNTWIRLRYPGTRTWMAELTAADAWTEMDDPLLDIILFGLECAREELRGWKASRHVNLGWLKQPLEETRVSRRSYAEWLPATNLRPTIEPALLLHRYRTEVWPELKARAAVILPSLWEQEVRIHCREALQLAQESILPTAARVLESDINRIVSLLHNNRTQLDHAWEIVNNPDRDALGKLLLEARKFSSKTAPSPKDASLRTLALRLIDTWIQGLNRVPMISVDSTERSTRQLPPSTTQKPLPPLANPVTSSTYEQAYQKVAAQVDLLARHMEEALRPRRRLGESSGYPTGLRLDLKKVMGFSADVRLYDQLWMRKTIPSRRSAAIMLLLDLSGSMRGEKSESLLVGTILLSETLDKLSIPFSVVGFQDILIPFRDFDRPYDSNARSTVAQLLREINGDRPRGNNQPSYNDDGPCLREAADRLLEYPATDRLLMVVSDGLPEGKRSNVQDLHHAIRDIRNDMSAIKLIGIGLGAGTDHVRDFYPESVANVPVNQFANEIGAVLKQALLGS